MKTGLLAGRPLWELPPAELVRRCAAYKAACLSRDPQDEGVRVVLNLGHTFAHALEAAAGYEGLATVAPLRSGCSPHSGCPDAPRTSSRSARPQPVRVDRERAWAAIQRDKKSARGELRLVLLDEDGPVVAARPEAEVRSALDELIAE